MGMGTGRQSDCAEKTSLVVQAQLKLEWSRRKYINYLDDEERGTLPDCVWVDG